MRALVQRLRRLRPPRSWRWRHLDGRRRMGLSLSAGLMAAAMAWALVPQPADAALREARGWWWRGQTGLGPRLDAPPHVPPDGVAVGATIDGATAITAVRFRLDDDESNPVLHLQVADSFGGDDAVIAACLAGSGWAPATVGTWDDRPTAACDSGSVNGVRADDGSEWTFALASLVLDDLIDVVIVPGAGTTPFEIGFAPVTSDSLETESGSDRPFFAPPPPPTFQPPPSFDSGGAGQETLAPPETRAPAFQPALPDEDTRVEESAPLVQAQRDTFGRSAFDPTPVSERADPRRLGILVLVGAATVAFMLSGAEVRPPRALGPMAGRRRAVAPVGLAEPEVRGLGRFARVRAGDAPRLF